MADSGDSALAIVLVDEKLADLFLGYPNILLQTEILRKPPRQFLAERERLLEIGQRFVILFESGFGSAQVLQIERERLLQIFILRIFRPHLFDDGEGFVEIDECFGRPVTKLGNGARVDQHDRQAVVGFRGIGQGCHQFAPECDPLFVEMPPLLRSGS